MKKKMMVTGNQKAIQHVWWNYSRIHLIRFTFIFIFLTGVLLFSNPSVKAQGCPSPVSGCFAGQVTDNRSGMALPGATVRFINQTNGIENVRTSDQNGNFQLGTLQPGVYEIEVTLEGYKTAKLTNRLYATRSNEVVLLPFHLEKETVVVINPNIPPVPTPTPTITSVPPDATPKPDATPEEPYPLNLNPRRDADFNSDQVATLPLGGTTLTRTFDELALLVPGVAPPPQAIGNSVGPGIGGGVGTSGQFAVNGLRSRANNFTVDGSDNNDEDIGVRRQGFFSLVPQSIESIQQFSIITLLAPAEFGRNLGAQVNAISKGGGNQFHGTIYGMANADFLNARNFFDNAGGDTSSLLRGRQSDGGFVPVFVDGTQPTISNNAGEKDVFTLLQGGFTIGGPIFRNKMFFFVSGEGQLLNGSKESHFIVPTVEQRGFVSSGASGLQQCPGQLDNIDNRTCRNANQVAINYVAGSPTSIDGNAVFSLFPFANDPNGIYGRNTYTQTLSTDARGGIFSGKIDYNLSFRGRPQVFTARYNHTDDRRDLTDVGGALFSSIRPLTRTDNFSTFFNGYLTDNISNELRFSWGRTRLKFEEIKDTTGFLLPVSRSFTNPDDARFLLNARVLQNNTSPTGCTPTGCFTPATRVIYSSAGTTEINSSLGLIGQLNIAGFSPVGVDVFNFPQQRVNNTFQIADILRRQFNEHSFSFGTDIRRTYLNSDLPRNSRPLVTFNGSPDYFELCGSDRRLCQTPMPPQTTPPTQTTPRTPTQNACRGRFCTAVDLASGGAATGFFQTLVLPGKDARINLSYNQLNFFAQDEWRINPKILLNFGLRYEYNTTPKEADRKIEDTFTQSLPAAVASLSNFIDGRDKIFDADRNNFAPRFGVAAALTDSTVVRGGFGVYYDQILGAVVSQSRNVFPTFSTLNFGGGNTRNPNDLALLNFSLFNPFRGNIGEPPIVQPGTINTLNPAITQTTLLTSILTSRTPTRSPFPFFNFDQTGTNRIAGSAFGATLPQRKLNTPLSYQYSIGIEQRLFQNTFLSVAYVGTQGQDLLRFTTPNLGTNYVIGVDRIDLISNQLVIAGATFDPTANPTGNLYAGRPVPLIGPISQFETTGRSRYNSLQIELRGRLSRNFQYQTSYVYGQVKDDVSDVFDLAGAFALPQNSLNFEGEYAPANFDVRHRFTYNFIYDTPEFRNNGKVLKYLLGGWQIAGTGKFNTGQPFTVNSIFDVNLDGNLTDRLNSTQFLTRTDDRRQPITIANNSDRSAMLAPFGKDGAIPRNSFRAGSILDLDLSFIKRFALREGQTLQFRTDIFNFINRANFGIPVRFLESPGFGQATDTVTPGRRLQIAVKYNF